MKKKSIQRAVFFAALALLVACVPEINKPSPNELLIDSAISGSTARIQAALGQGALVNFQDERGRSALHYAALYGRLDVAQFLVKHGANIDAITESGDTALHLAAYKGHVDVIKFLLENGADASIHDFAGLSAEDWAREYSHAEAERMLRNYPVHPKPDAPAPAEPKPQ